MSIYGDLQGCADEDARRALLQRSMHQIGTWGPATLLKSVLENDAPMIEMLSMLVDAEGNPINPNDDSTGNSVMNEFNSGMNELSGRVPLQKLSLSTLYIISSLKGMREIVDPERGTLLMRAIDSGHIYIVNHILNWKNLHINYQNDLGHTALMKCGNIHRQRGHGATLHNTMHALQKLTRSPHLDMNIRDRNGFTALYHYATINNEEAIQVLLDCESCDASIGTDDGQTPLTHLIRNMFIESLHVLLESGKPLGIIYILDWIEFGPGIHNARFTQMTDILSDHITRAIAAREANITNTYYGYHRQEQRLLEEIDAGYRSLPDILTGGSPELDVFLESVSERKENVFQIRQRLNNIHSSVMQVNTREINDKDLRTPFMLIVDILLLELRENSASQTVALYQRYVYFFLKVFKPMYTNIYIQDRNTKDLWERLNTLVTIYDDQLTVQVREEIKEYIHISMIHHVPLARDFSIAPMTGMVPCENTRFSPIHDEVNIWISGKFSCCVYESSITEDLTESSIHGNIHHIYSIDDSRFQYLLRERDAIPHNEDIHMLLPEWDMVENSYRMRGLFGVNRVPESESWLYQFVRIS